MATIQSEAASLLASSNKVRPYRSGMLHHRESLATILLMTNSAQNETSDKEEGKDINYFLDLTRQVQTLEPDPRVEDPTILRNFSQGKVQTLSLDGKHDYYGVFNNFSLLSVSEGKGEIVKIHQNFGPSWNAFFFGKKPEVYQFQGFFIDSMNYPYYQEFMTAYTHFLAGRKCVENQTSMKIIYDGKIIDGYLLSINVDMNAASDLKKSFTFSVLVRAEGFIRENIIEVGGAFEDTIHRIGPNFMSNEARNEAFPAYSGDATDDTLLQSNNDDAVIKTRKNQANV